MLPGPRANAPSLRWLVLSLVVLSEGCGPSAADLASVDYTPVARDDWPVATPAEVGLDSAALARLYWRASNAETTYAVLVVKNGRLVAEQYYHGVDIDTPTNLQSATKSVLSALVGIAVDDGCIPGVHVPVMDYFPELTDSIRDPRKLDITLEHLLQMRAGFQWEEANDQLFQLLYSGYRPVHLATVELIRDPGAAMEYSNLSSHLAGIVLARACETDLLDFANEHLFGPLGVEPGEWWFSWEDYRLGMSSLHLTARDMARFGQLYLNGGTWDGVQILTPEWVDRSLAIQSENAWHIGIGANVRDLAYGYQWWTVRSGTHEYKMAWGHGGQHIVVLPEHDLVVVVKADPLESQHGGGPWKKEKENLNLVGDFIASLPPAPGPGVGGEAALARTPEAPADAAPDDPPAGPDEPATAQDTLPSVQAILAHYVAAVGGREALQGLETRTLAGREIDDRPYRGPAHEKSLEAVAVYPDHWSITFTDSLVEREWCDGARVWSSRSGVSGPSDAAVRSKQSFLLDPQGPLRLHEYFPGLAVVGRETRSGHDVWVLENDLDPTYNALAFDVETGLLVQIGWYWTLEDYREFDGVRIPTRVGQSRKGGSTTWVWDTVVHNQPVNPMVFGGQGG